MEIHQVRNKVWLPWRMLQVDISSDILICYIRTPAKEEPHNTQSYSNQ